MFQISGTKITMIRGDTVRIQLSITDADGEAYEPANGDIIRFALKKSYNDNEPILVKTIPNDTLLLELLPEDTKGLKFGNLNGVYKYDIEITQEDGTVDTIIPRAELVILEEVD